MDSGRTASRLEIWTDAQDEIRSAERPVRQQPALFHTIGVVLTRRMERQHERFAKQPGEQGNWNVLLREPVHMDEVVSAV